jgi:hypothetical protein
MFRKLQSSTTTRYLTAAALLAVLAFGVNFITAPTDAAGAGNGNGKKPLLEKIVEHRDFFIHPNGLGPDGLSPEAFLCDINDAIGENRLGLLLLEPSGILRSPVFDRDTHEKIYEETSVPPKKLRTELARNGIRLSDARLIAGSIAGLREDIKIRRKPEKGFRNSRGVRHSLKWREVMPQSLPEGFSLRPKKRDLPETKQALNRMREDVARNDSISAMTSDEILERFRSDVARRKEAVSAP